VTDFRVQMVQYFRAQADWRGRKATEHGDPRVQQAAEQFRALATYIERLPDDHEDLGVIEGAQPVGIGVYSPGQPAAQRRIDRFGLDSSHPDFTQFLKDLAEAETGDAVDFEHEDIPPAFPPA
jgi:hypothetical protein